MSSESQNPCICPDQWNPDIPHPELCHAAAKLCKWRSLANPVWNPETQMSERVSAPKEKL
jgi:hypothetical protein